MYPIPADFIVTTAPSRAQGQPAQDWGWIWGSSCWLMGISVICSISWSAVLCGISTGLVWRIYRIKCRIHRILRKSVFFGSAVFLYRQCFCYTKSKHQYVQSDGHHTFVTWGLATFSWRYWQIVILLTNLLWDNHSDWMLVPFPQLIIGLLLYFKTLFL